MSPVIVKTQHHCDGLAAKRTATALIVHCVGTRLTETLMTARHQRESSVTRCHGFPYVIPPAFSTPAVYCIFHSRVFSAPMETQLFISVAVDVIIDKTLYLIMAILYISRGKPLCVTAVLYYYYSSSSSFKR